MSSERSPAILVFGVAAAILGGGGYYFLKIYRPKQARSAAQTEVTGWEARWHAARTCMLGEHTLSSKPAEALAIRDLEPDLVNRNACSPLLAKLSRGSAPDTGLPEVEDAWVAIDRAAGKVATAFVMHLEPGTRTSKANDPLPTALDGMDSAGAALRAAAGMTAAEAEGAPLPAATILPLLATSVGHPTWFVPSAHGTVMFAADHTGDVEILLQPGAEPRILRADPPVDHGVFSTGDDPARPDPVMRAVPDPSWGAAGRGDVVTIGAVATNGGFTSSHEVPSPLDADVHVVLGTAADGIVISSNEGQLVVGHAQGDAFTAAKPVPKAGGAAIAEDPIGKGVIAWADTTGTLRGVIATPGKPPVTVELGAGAPTAACLTDDHAWVASNGQFVAFDDQTATPHLLPEHKLVACSATMALLHANATSQYAVCGTSCRIVELARMQPSSIATIAGDQVVAIATRGNVIGMWREHGAPLYFAIATPVHVHFAMSDGKVVDVMGETDTGAVLVRLPLH